MLSIILNVLPIIILVIAIIIFRLLARKRGLIPSIITLVLSIALAVASLFISYAVAGKLTNGVLNKIRTIAASQNSAPEVSQVVIGILDEENPGIEEEYEKRDSFLDIICDLDNRPAMKAYTTAIVTGMIACIMYAFIYLALMLIVDLIGGIFTKKIVPGRKKKAASGAIGVLTAFVFTLLILAPIYNLLATAGNCATAVSGILFEVNVPDNANEADKERAETAKKRVASLEKLSDNWMARINSKSFMPTKAMYELLMTTDVNGEKTVVSRDIDMLALVNNAGGAADTIKNSGGLTAVVNEVAPGGVELLGVIADLDSGANCSDSVKELLMADTSGFGTIANAISDKVKIKNYDAVNAFCETLAYSAVSEEKIDNESERLANVLDFAYHMNVDKSASLDMIFKDENEKTEFATNLLGSEIATAACMNIVRNGFLNGRPASQVDAFCDFLTNTAKSLGPDEIARANELVTYIREN